MARAHVIGAGLAGLAAAIALTKAGYAVTLSEAGPRAGGRCRSYHDPQLGLTIDNGNHLVLSGNAAVADHLATIGAADRLAGPMEASFAFFDLRDGERWRVAPNGGPLPWWLFVPGRRVPGTGVADYLPLARLLGADADARIGDVIATDTPLWERLIAPLMVAVMNTPPAEASAGLAAAVIRETLAKGGRACRPRIAHPTLAAAFVDPAIAWLRSHGADIRMGRRLKALRFAGDRVDRLDFADGADAVATDDPVILAVPAWVAADLVPGLTVPDRHHAIVNAHFAFPPPPALPPMLGVIGGTAEWIFAFPDRISVTISAADRLCEEDRGALAARLWAEVARAAGIDAPLPPWQIVRERRATFAATPDQDARRPGAATAWANLMLAGDWTRTGLPATIEGAIRSGRTAAHLAGEVARAHVSV
ncbi:squalene-associated FAD-dependent desaturase [Sphingomonas sp. MM-1]|uniref:hydroxysqualene dehydroxylase HpnE n=1 Tax=Sphingomonas sp. MM-1 TaxID=745310 RepID=UPI0002C08F06|nr:hydroxysqualene dehydroxylase HpnE [Sphingomonas sp. MM-1]AGH49562.1 squalene-associated FAD-dependent desaturase [Sphingomonas sp. MM-1]